MVVKSTDKEDTQKKADICVYHWNERQRNQCRVRIHFQCTYVSIAQCKSELMDFVRSKWMIFYIF